MHQSCPRILLFDSGIGGLSIADAIRLRLPDADMVYAGDNAGFPYGDLPEHEVVARCVALVEKALARWPCALVVVACNTASTVVLPMLRSRLRLPVVGVVPAIKPAAALSRNRRLGVLATPATVDRPYLASLIDEYAADCTVLRLGSSELVRIAEMGLAQGWVDDEQVRAILQPLAAGDPDTVVLGCTHFPLIREALARAMPGVRHWVDSGDAIARRVVQLLDETTGDGTGTGQGSSTFLFTAEPPAGLRHWLEVSQPGTRGGGPQISRVNLNTARNSSIGSAGLWQQ
ncbi:glutamate racemase [Halospina sp. K52047b]|uniref:glutamate racemase n=1 Tax=Halospina sp. K52047b TaxID=2614160 RepID=UPI00124A241C|nr:glutamate racemase [Halospina sp. K52047b]KAA8978525.1 glutamate racemase [Halospina sp. K52047b]